jgi:hypothetical protein
MALKSCRAVLIVGCSVCLSVRSANAQHVVRTCPTVEIRTLSVSFQLERPIPPGAPPGTGEIAPASVSTKTSGTDESLVTVIALGPILGAMDSREVKTDLACTPKGIVLTARISRSADFKGAVAANVSWRPEIEIGIVLRRPEVIIQTTWRMTLTTGEELDRATTPPYPENKYPVTVTKPIRTMK